MKYQLAQQWGIADVHTLPIELNPVFTRRMLIALDGIAQEAPNVTARNEDFWSAMRDQYITSGFLNLNFGGVSPQPVCVQEAEHRLTRFLNYCPAHHMWAVLEPARERVREMLAETAGCAPEETALLRNVTEAMGNLIYGLPLNPGDEVVLSTHDYPNVVELWKNRAERDGLVLKWVEPPATVDNDADYLHLYREALTPRTRALNLTHMVNWTGRLLPVADISRQAMQQGVFVVIDAAHTFQQIPFRFDSIPCTGIATVLHKWLSAPFGTGMLYVPKENIRLLRPIFPLKETAPHDIRKFEGLGTRNYGSELATAHAVQFMQAIGIERKHARFQYLKQYWTSRLQPLVQQGRVQITTPLSPEHSCNLVHLTFPQGPSHHVVAQRLLNEYQIGAITFDWANISGMRITPNVYTAPTEMDRFIHALEAVLGAA